MAVNVLTIVIVIVALLMIHIKTTQQTQSSNVGSEKIFSRLNLIRGHSLSLSFSEAAALACLYCLTMQSMHC